MKRTTKILSGTAAVILGCLWISGPTLAQKNKPPRTTELYADFRDAYGDKIHSNGAGSLYSNDDTSGYPNNVIFSEGGSLYMRIQQTQRVFFDFTDPIRDWKDPDWGVKCRAWSPTGTGTEFSLPGPPPAFLLGDGRPDNYLTIIQTGGGYTLKDDGDWSYDREYVDLRTIATVAYVVMSIRFDIPDESIFMFFGSHIWTPDYAKPENGWTGIVQITRENDATWLIEPLPVEHRIAIERGLEADQTSLFMLGSTGKGNKGLSGNCDLGDWRMPFALTLTLR